MLIADVGVRGMGKSTLSIYQADRSPRRLVLDPRRQVRRPGAVVVQHAERLHDGVLALADGETAEVVYSPRERDFEAAFQAFAAEMAWWVDHHRMTPIAIVVDEVTFYGRQTLSSSVDFMYALKSCEIEPYRIILTGHRPVDIDPDVRFHLNRFCIFRTEQDLDLDVIRRRCGADTADLVRQLDDRQFVEWRDTQRGGPRVHRAPSIWYTNLHPRNAERYIVHLEAA